jgi:Protein of unknown function (DUF2924)
MVDVPQQVAELPNLSRQQLSRLWQQTFGESVPILRKKLLVLCLAYRLQEQIYGGLSPQWRRELRRLSQFPAETKIRGIKTGTRLRRDWKGESHEALVTPRGYEYRANYYKSLSAIARQITQTRWSGPAFFGLRKSSSSAKEAT